MLKMNLDSSDFRTGHGGGMQIETAAMEMDGDPEVVWIAIATGPFPDVGNPGARFRTRHARRWRMQADEEWGSVQMAPSPFRQMIAHARLSPGLGTCEAPARRSANMNVNLLPRDVQFGSLHRPGRCQPRELSVQLHAVHRMSPFQTMRGSVLPTHRNV